MGETIRQLVERLRRDAAAQKKKTAGLGVLFLILVVAVGRLFWTGEAPTKVVAAPAPVVNAPEVVVPTPGPPPTSRPRPGAGRSGATSAKVAEDPSEAPRSRNLSGLPRTLARNPFRSAAWKLPVRKDADAEISPAETWLSRLSEQWSDYQAKADAVEHLADERLSKLELQSTMIGPISSAYISGRLVHQGDEIEGFTVFHIENRRVTLQFSGVTRVLNAP
ncbi:MAG TPA: hypothetical protein P5081_12445 [Phycisphaerae bacterium]|nr:hypothetical protein [Phycisphaerae bacterium]